jgi:hypothetical protein
VLWLQTSNKRSTPMPDHQAGNSPAPEPRRFQFGIRLLFFLMLVAAIAAGIFAALVRAIERQADTAYFIVLVVAAPVGFMVLVSLWKTIEDFLASRRNERQSPDDSS